MANGREIAAKAYDFMLKYGQTESAARLKKALDTAEYITLSYGDVDWDIQTALEKYGATFHYTYPHNFARFTFDKDYDA